MSSHYFPLQMGTKKGVLTLLVLLTKEGDGGDSTSAPLLQMGTKDGIDFIHFSFTNVVEMGNKCNYISMKEGGLPPISTDKCIHPSILISVSPYPPDKCITLSPLIRVLLPPDKAISFPLTSLSHPPLIRGGRGG